MAKLKKNMTKAITFRAGAATEYTIIGLVRKLGLSKTSAICMGIARLGEEEGIDWKEEMRLFEEEMARQAHEEELQDEG